MKKEEYEVGKWYWFEGLAFDWIARFNYYNDLEFWYTECYDTLGVMISHDWCCVTNLKGLATPTQIETCLKAYAEKNGYIKGVEYISVYNGYRFDIDDDHFEYSIQQDMLSTENAMSILYYQGKWAEIVAHAPSIQDKQDEALTDSIHEFVKNKDLIVNCTTDEHGNYDLSSIYVYLDDKEVTLKELCETYYKMLDIKTIIG